MPIRGTVRIDIENCKGCELCVGACQEKCLAMSKGINKKGYHYAILLNDNCTGCINCALVCPDAVITVYRTSKKKTKEPIEIIKESTQETRVVINNPVIPNGEGKIQL